MPLTFAEKLVVGIIGGAGTAVVAHLVKGKIPDWAAAAAVAAIPVMVSTFMTTEFKKS